MGEASFRLTDYCIIQDVELSDPRIYSTNCVGKRLIAVKHIPTQKRAQAIGIHYSPTLKRAISKIEGELKNV